MARPALPPQLKRSQDVATTVRPDEADLIHQLAERDGVRRSEIAYRALRELLDREFPDVDADQAEAIAA